MKRFMSLAGRLSLAGSLVLTTVLLAGCNEDSLAPEADASLLGESGVAAEGLFNPPSLSELESRLGLTPEQSLQMAAILDDAKALAAERQDARRQRGPGAGLAEAGPRAGGLLADAAAILETGQLQEFTAMMTERRQERREQMKERLEAHQGMAGIHEKMAQRFGLSDDERKALAELHRSSGDRMRSLHEQYAAGSISAEQLRDGLRDIRVEAEAKVRGTLGDQAFDRMHDRRADRREQMASKRLEMLDETPARHAEMLGKALRLSTDQTSAVAGVLTKSLPAREALLTQVRSGSLAPEEVLYQGIQIKNEAAAGIEALLTPDQKARFVAIEDLLPGRMGPGMPGMPHH